MLLYALAPTLDEQVASGRAYVQRVREQLAGVLYEDQFAVFDQMQLELLSDMRQVLKEEAEERAARGQTAAHIPAAAE
jgi:hypothetical protein